MKKFLSLSLALTLLTLLFTSCSTTTVQITPENFEQYFEISVITEDYESDGVGFFSGPSTATVTISIVPKQTISSGNINAVLKSNLVGWDCEYSTQKTQNGITISDGLRVPIQFSPNQTYTKSFRIENTIGSLSEPTIKFEVVEASGTIKI